MPERWQAMVAGIEALAQERLAALAAEAEALAAAFYAQAAQERARRARSQWGRLGVRVRPLRGERAAPGAFAIEWFTRRWANRTGAGAKPFTTYLRRGAGERYPPKAFAAVAEPWEQALAEAFEAQFGELRRLAQSVARLRMATRQHAKLEERVAARRCAWENPDDARAP
jgi:hypothetical protein